MPNATIGQRWNYTTPGTFLFTIPESGLYTVQCMGAQGGGGPTVLDNYEKTGSAMGYTILHADGCSYQRLYHQSNSYTTCTKCGHSGSCIRSYTVNNNYSWVARSVGSLGGLGGTVSGDIYLKKGEQIYISVGGQGTLSTTLNSGGGYNGGGHGGPQGNGGGGASDVKYKYQKLSSRFIVAGGGGGADDYGTMRQNQAHFNKSGVLGGTGDGSGGNGGGLTAGNGRINGSQYQSAASQTSGFQLGQGQSVTVNSDCGGGGGGYYGGTTANSTSYGGGGGSSYLSPILRDTTNVQGNNYGNGSVVLTLKKLMNFQHYALKVKDKEEYYILSDNLKDENGLLKPINRNYLFDISNVNNFYINSLSETFKNGIPNEIRFKDIQIMKIQGYRDIEYDNLLNTDSNFGYGVYQTENETNKVDLYKINNIRMVFKQLLNVMKHNIIKLKSNLVILSDVYNTSITVNSESITFALQDNDVIYGKNFEIITKDEIYKKGFTKDDLVNISDYDLNNFSILMIFNISYPVTELNLVSITNTIPSLKERVNEKNYDTFFDKENERCYIKFYNNHSIVHVNKITTTVKNQDSINSIGEF